MATFTGTNGDDILPPLGADDTGDDDFFALGGNDVVKGGLGDDSVDAAGGNDKIYGEDGNDTLSGGADNDKLYGGDGIDHLDGGGGNDTLVGGLGADTMVGNFGDDRYYVDDVGDVLTEFSAGDGFDRAYASVTFTLSQFVDDLYLTGGSAIDGTGNGDANRIVGNAAANKLNGLGGNDTLDGGLGADTMAGGTGNDFYTVDNTHDVVDETGGDGIDKVSSSVTFNLAGSRAIGNVEKLTLTGAAAINGTGNALDNAITGNAAANALYGAGGNDTLRGGAGNDRLDGGSGVDTMKGETGNDLYFVDEAGDTVIESLDEVGSVDRVYASVDYVLSGVGVEILSTDSVAGTSAIDLTGNFQQNTLYGNAGNNILDGRDGSDTLKGYGGADSFVFGDPLGAMNIDTIGDFSVADDTIRLENAIFGAIVGTGTLTADQFINNTTGIASDSSDRIVYEADTGKLFYDINGNAAGGSIWFGRLDSGLTLTNADFFVT